MNIRKNILLVCVVVYTNSLSAQTAEELYAAGVTAIEKGDYPAALVAFNKAVAKDTAYWQAWIQKGYTSLIYFQDTTGALSDYSKAIAVAPSVAEGYYYRGLLRQEMLQNGRANIDFTKAILLNPNNTDFYFQRGRSRLAINELQSALEDFDEVVKRLPESSTAYFYRGYVKATLGNPAAALEDFTASLSLQESAETYYQRANVYRELKQYANALSDVNKALKFRPGYADAYFLRGVVKTEIGEKSDGVADVVLARKLGLKPGKKTRRAAAFEDSLYVYAAPELVVEAETPEYKEAIRDSKQLALRGRNALATKIISVSAPTTFLPSTPPSPINSLNTVDCNKQTLLMRRLTELNILCVARLLKDEIRVLRDPIADNIVAQISDIANELSVLEDNLLRGAVSDLAAAADRQRRIQLLVNVQQLMGDLQEHLDQKTVRKAE